MESIIEKSLVQDLLPQKAPMTMADKLLLFEENHLVAGLTVTADNIFVQDGQLSESGIIEHMAQSVALYTSYGYHIKSKKAPEGYIGSIKEVTIIKLPAIGDSLVTEVDVLQEFMGITLVNIVTRVNDEVVAKSQMKTVLAK